MTELRGKEEEAQLGQFVFSKILGETYNTEDHQICLVGEIRISKSSKGRASLVLNGLVVRV